MQSGNTCWQTGKTACSYFQDHEIDDSIDETYYQIAYDVAVKKEKELNER